MVFIDASTRWSRVCLLSIRNVDFARLLAQIIKLRAQFSDHPIKSFQLDNAKVTIRVFLTSLLYVHFPLSNTSK